ncbi:MAG: hypothetical protein JWQ24_4975 [Tardiphaga sp.]|nr:hypothetical protein [Tardiphaga sp.]
MRSLDDPRQHRPVKIAVAGIGGFPEQPVGELRALEPDIGGAGSDQRLQLLEDRIIGADHDSKRAFFSGLSRPHNRRVGMVCAPRHG